MLKATLTPGDLSNWVRRSTAYWETSSLTRSLQRVASILGNLRDFTRGRLGVAVPVSRSTANMGTIFQQALDDPQVRARDMVVEVTLATGETVRLPGNPIKLSGAEPHAFSRPPALGAARDG